MGLFDMLFGGAPKSKNPIYDKDGNIIADENGFYTRSLAEFNKKFQENPDNANRTSRTTVDAYSPGKDGKYHKTN